MNALAKNETGTSVANVDPSNPYAAYAAEASTRTIVGTLLKFAKGEWTKGQNDVVVPLNTKFVADMRNVQVGWVRWENKKPVEHQMGRIADNYRPANRSALGYNDKAEWELDKDGKPQDPWQSTSILFLMDQEGEIFTYSPSSAGGRNCIVALCGTYGKLMRQHPGELPVIEIGVDSYRHETYGKTFVPMLKIVSWHSEADFDEAQAAEEAEAAARSETDTVAQKSADPAPRTVEQPSVEPAAAAADSGFGFKKGPKAPSVAASQAARF